MSIKSAHNFYGQDVVSTILAQQTNNVPFSITEAKEAFNTLGFLLIEKIANLCPDISEINEANKTQAAELARQLFNLFRLNYFKADFITQNNGAGHILLNELIKNLDKILFLSEDKEQEVFFDNLSQAVRKLDESALKMQDKDGNTVFNAISSSIKNVADASIDKAIKLIELCEWGAINSPNVIIQLNNEKELVVNELIAILDELFASDDLKDDDGNYDAGKQQKLFAAVESLINHLPTKVQQAKDMDGDNIFTQLVQNILYIGQTSPSIAYQVLALIRKAPLKMLLIEDNDNYHTFDHLLTEGKNVALFKPGLAKEMLQIVLQHAATVYPDEYDDYLTEQLIRYYSSLSKAQSINGVLQETVGQMLRVPLQKHGLSLDEINSISNKAFYMYKHIKMFTDANKLQEITEFDALRDKLYNFKNALGASSGIEGDDGEPCLDEDLSITGTAYCQHSDPFSEDNASEFIARFTEKQGDEDPYPIQEAKYELSGIKALLKKHNLELSSEDIFTDQCNDTTFQNSNFGLQVCADE